jgi:glycoside/pentoside/hexuronide:cation symporter, GPH family
MDQGQMKQDMRVGRAIAYGSGDLGFNFFYTGLNLYLLFYYTDVIGIPPVTAGLIFMIPVIWDAITDPAMGTIASRTRTRFGRYRPYILFGAPVLCVSFVMMFAAPLIWPGAAVLACFISHIVFRTVYTVVNIPYTALSAAMTRSSRDRTLLAGARMQFATFGGIATAFLMPVLAARFGGVDMKLGYLLTAITFAIAALCIFMICMAATKEPEHIGDEAPKPLRETARFLACNGPFWMIFLAVLVAATGSSIAGKSLVYYIAYYAGQPDAVSLVLTLQTFMAGVSVVFWTLLGRRFPKKWVWIAGASLALLAHLTLYALKPTDLGMIYGLVGLVGFGVGAFIVMFWSMLPDTVEYGQWKSGIRDEGIVFGLNQLALKAATGIGVGLLGLALGLIGYQAGQPQSQETLDGLAALSFLFPAVTAIASMAIISQYPISAVLHARIVADLNDPKPVHDGAPD